MLTFVGLAHMVDATKSKHDGVGWSQEGCYNVCRTCTHG